MNDQQQANQKPWPRYVKVPQSMLNFENRKMSTFADLVEIAEDLGKYEHLRYSYDGEPPIKASWGSVVYKIADDNSLTVHSRHVDTSD